MRTLTAKEARKLAKESKMEVDFSTGNEMEQYIGRINEMINNTAGNSETCISILARWNVKFDKMLKKYFRKFGYSVSVTYSSKRPGRFLKISWNPWWIMRMWEIL